MAEGPRVVVVGGGPAGLAAATAAAESGARVLLIDDNHAPGGQIWRRERGAGDSPGAARWLKRARSAGAEVRVDCQLIDLASPRSLTVTESGRAVTVRCDRLVLATGARELFLPFPGWTLPGVAGAGGLHALVKGGWPVSGARVVVAGSGPLLLAVADHLQRCGARVLLVAEQATSGRVAAFAAGLVAYPGKAARAARLGWALRGVPRRYSCWPVRAGGEGRLQRVTLRRAGGEISLECDLLACGFGLVPNLEVASYLGCELLEDGVRVDERMESSVEGVYCAGEINGIGGVEVAEVEGSIAGHAAAGDERRAAALGPRWRRERRFAAALQGAFALRAELREPPAPATIFCRCEDVPFAAVLRYADARDAKLKTRCGMGTCQGRVCGAAGRFLLGWRRDRVRPPFFPTPVAALASAGDVGIEAD